MLQRFPALCLFFFISLFASAQNKALTDSLEKMLAASPVDSVKIKILGDLCWEFGFSDKAKAISYGKEALQLAKDNNDEKAIGQCYNDLGSVHHRYGEYRSAKEYYRQALEIREKQQDKRNIAATLTKIASIDEVEGRYKESLENHLRALKLFGEAKDARGEVYTLSNIGQLYLALNKYDQALEYSLKAKDFFEKSGEKAPYAAALNNLAHIYEAKKDYPRAIEALQTELKIYEELNLPTNIAVVSHNLGTFLSERGNNNKAALEYLLKAKALREQLGDKNGMSTTYSVLGTIYAANGDHAAALKYFEDALTLAREINFKSQIKTCYEKLSQLYATKGQHAKAYEYMQFAYALKDSLFTEESTKQIAEMQTRYETETKEQEIALQQLQLDQQQLQLGQQRAQLFILIGTIAFILVLSVLFYNRYKLKQKQLLSEELLKQEKLRVKAIISTQEAERKRIAEELHDGIGQMLSAVKLNVAALDAVNGKETQLQNAIGLIDDSCRELRNISHNMMPGILVKAGLIPALNEYTGTLTSSRALTVYFEADSELPNRMSDVIDVNLFRIIQELLNNIVKYARATEVHVSINRTDEGISVMIEDNGKGFDKKILEASSGNGWYNINSRLGVINGKVEIDSQPGKGTVVFIEVPLQIPSLV